MRLDHLLSMETGTECHDSVIRVKTRSVHRRLGTDLLLFNFQGPEMILAIFGSRSLPSGGDDGIRTHDPLLAGQVLSQLSYTPIFIFMGLCFFLLKDPSKLNNDLSKYSTFYELRLFVAYILVIYGRFSIERR